MKGPTSRRSWHDYWWAFALTAIALQIASEWPNPLRMGAGVFILHCAFGVGYLLRVRALRMLARPGSDDG